MSLNATPSGERVHIGFFGRRNAGKSSLVNAVTGQQLAVVSPQKGTTTDPVYKSMELLPLGPVVMIDTPGFDDEGELGSLRIQKARQVLNKTDIAVLVVDACEGLQPCDQQLIDLFAAKQIPYLVVYNKQDLAPGQPCPSGALPVSALRHEGITQLKERLAGLRQAQSDKRLVGDLVSAGDFVVLVVPIDESAPKGRLILPQQQAIRDLLDQGATAIVTKDTHLAATLAGLGQKPALVVTDSQAFGPVSQVVPADIPLTSFSILMAQYKGLLEEAVKGVAAIPALRDGDTVLIAEGCTHHRQCNDIGTVKIPRWLRDYTGRDLRIESCSGTQFPEDLHAYSLVVHCGGCMLNEREVRYRTQCAADQGVPITNFGTLIAYLHGILPRSLEVFPALRALLPDCARQQPR